MSQKKWGKEKLIPFRVIHLRVPRKYILNGYHSQELKIGDRAKFSKIKDDMEKIINMANHVISIIDSTTRTAVQKDI
jgi:hypothetical protein